MPTGPHPVRAHDALVVVQKGDHSAGYYDFHAGAELHRVSLDPFPRDPDTAVVVSVSD